MSELELSTIVQIRFKLSLPRPSFKIRVYSQMWQLLHADIMLLPLVGWIIIFDLFVIDAIPFLARSGLYY